MVAHQVQKGITPAYAGTRGSGCKPVGRSQDHPRIRGDKVWSCATLYKTPGSPPHTRGQVSRESVSAAWKGITPAYAGTRLNNDRFYVISSFDFLSIPLVCNTEPESVHSPPWHGEGPEAAARNALPVLSACNPSRQRPFVLPDQVRPHTG